MSSVVTWPESTMAEREGLTVICSSGKTRRSSSAAALTSTSTRRSKLRERSSSSQIKSETSPADRPCTKICVGVTTIASATPGSVTETLLSLSVVLMSSDLPTITRSGAAPCDSDSEGAWADAAGPCSGADCIGDAGGTDCWAGGACVSGGCLGYAPCGAAGSCNATLIAQSSNSVPATTPKDRLVRISRFSHLRERIDMFLFTSYSGLVPRTCPLPSCLPYKLPLCKRWVSKEQPGLRRVWPYCATAPTELARTHIYTEN